MKSTELSIRLSSVENEAINYLSYKMGYSKSAILLLGLGKVAKDYIDMAYKCQFDCPSILFEFASKYYDLSREDK